MIDARGDEYYQVCFGGFEAFAAEQSAEYGDSSEEREPPDYFGGFILHQSSDYKGLPVFYHNATVGQS